MSYIRLNEYDFLHVGHPGHYTIEVEYGHSGVRLMFHRKSNNWSVVTIRWRERLEKEDRYFYDFGEAERCFNEQIRKLSAELAERALDLDNNQT
jgi:hypothetical protein